MTPAGRKSACLETARVPNNAHFNLSRLILIRMRLCRLRQLKKKAKLDVAIIRILGEFSVHVLLCQF